VSHKLRRDFVWFFNDRRSPFWDWVFVNGTKLGEPIGYILAAGGLIFLRLRYVIFLPLVGFTNTLLTHSLKSWFRRDRPLPFFEDLNLEDMLIFVEGVRVNSGANSFPSGHTMSGFALFAFVAFCAPRKKWGAVLFFLLALLVGFSRIYLTQHFFEDVYLGAIVGVLVGIFWYFVQFGIQSSWLDWRLRWR